MRTDAQSLIGLWLAFCALFLFMQTYKNLSLENLDGEIWVDIENFEGLYQISNMGRVKALGKIVYLGGGHRTKKIIKENIKAQGINTSGYPIVCIYKNSKGHTKSVHRLVAKAFIPNPENKAQVNHKDCDKKNNTIYNREWATSFENMFHLYHIFGHKNPTKGRNVAAKKVYHYTISGDFIAEYQSITSASEATGLFVSGISLCCLGKGSSCGGFIFSYTELPKEHFKDLKYGHGGYATRKINQFDLDMNFIKQYNSISEAIRETQISSGSIYRCLANKNKKFGEYIWRYDD